MGRGFVGHEFIALSTSSCRHCSSLTDTTGKQPIMDVDSSNRSMRDTNDLEECLEEMPTMDQTLSSNNKNQGSRKGEQSLVEPDTSYPHTSVSLQYNESKKDHSQEENDPFRSHNPDSQEPVSPGDHATAERSLVSPDNNPDDLSTSHSLSNETSKQETEGDSSKRPSPEETNLRDIIGHEEVKQRIAELTLPLLLPESVLQSVFKGIRRLPTTILLHGPPGCGKVRTHEYSPGYERSLTQNILSRRLN